MHFGKFVIYRKITVIIKYTRFSQDTLANELSNFKYSIIFLIII